MALPVTPAQQIMVLEALRRFLDGAVKPRDIPAVMKMSEIFREAMRGDVVAIPCNKAEPHDP